MALLKEEKAQIVTEYGRTENDTGSPEVQIAMLTQEIRDLTEHLKIHKHDFHTQHGLMKKVGMRKRLMLYLHRENPSGYRKLIENLGIRG
jgi:small subunit ribosomal protein S15